MYIQGAVFFVRDLFAFSAASLVFFFLFIQRDKNQMIVVTQLMTSIKSGNFT